MTVRWLAQPPLPPFQPQLRRDFQGGSKKQPILNCRRRKPFTITNEITGYQSGRFKLSLEADHLDARHLAPLYGS